MFINVYRLTVGIKLRQVFFLITVMERILQHTLFFHCTVKLFKYSCIMMSLNCATLWGQKSKFINWVGSYIHYCQFPIIVYITGSFYFILGNLPPRYRSRLTSIYLLALVKSSVIVDYWMDAVMQPFIDDLKKLVVVFYWVGLKKAAVQ